MHLNWRMILGGALRGTLPNPELVVDEVQLQLAARIFGPKPGAVTVSFAGIKIL